MEYSVKSKSEKKEKKWEKKVKVYKCRWNYTDIYTHIQEGSKYNWLVAGSLAGWGAEL